MAERRSASLFPFRVDSSGVGLAGWQGPRSGPPVLFVHGYPDTHRVWSRVIGRLAADFHCITYDVRGAGASDVPDQRDAYRLERLRGDLAAVIEAASPDEPVHLVAHDWGSLQAWDAVIREPSDPRLTGRIASLTTISGPCLHHIAAFRRDAPRLDVLRQGLRSWYVYAFHVPRVPELLLRRFGPTAARPDDAVHGLNLYRANIFRRERLPGPPTTDLPVQLVVLLRDRYVTPAMVDVAGRFAPDLTRVEVDAQHWAPRTHPDQLAAHISSFVRTHA